MNDIRTELQEYIVVTTPTCNQTASITTEYKWGKNETRILIDLYYKYRKKVGTFDIRTIKMMWQKIAEELKKFSMNVTANNCINRWKVLERNYKKFIDSQNQTGSGRKHFEYEEEMGEIFGRKRNIHPELLLASDTVDNTLPQSDTDRDNSDIIAKDTEVFLTTPVGPSRKKNLVIKQKVSAMEKIRAERKEYHEARLEIEREKLEEMKTRNMLIAERNEILRTKNCNCQCNLSLL